MLILDLYSHFKMPKSSLFIYFLISSIICMVSIEIHCQKVGKLRDKVILLSQGSRLLSVDPVTKNITTLFYASRKIHAFDFYQPQDEFDSLTLIFFSDCDGDKLYKATADRFIEGKWWISTMIYYSLGFIESISVDWLHKRVYWSDSKYHQIESSNFIGSFRTSVISNIRTKGTIIVDPIQKFMFWINCNTASFHIMKSHLSGHNNTAIAEIQGKGSCPTNLVIASENRLFWVEDSYLKSVHSSHYNGTTLPSLTVSPEASGPLYSMSYFQNNIYAAVGSSLISRNVSENSTSLISVFDEKLDSAVIRVYYQFNVQQSDSVNPCEIESRNMCSDICFPSPENSIECGCPYGLTLKPELGVCHYIHEHVYMFEANSHLHLTGTPANPSTNFMSPIVFPHQSGKILIDIYENIFYWTTETLDQLKMARNLYHSDTLLSWGNIRPTAMAIDGTSGNIYIASLNSEIKPQHFGPAISVCSSSGSFFMNIVIEDLSQPIFLKLFPGEGLLYFVDVQDNFSFLKMCKMDGSDMNIIFKTSSEITALEIDKKTGEIFWAEESSDGQAELKSKFGNGPISFQISVSSRIVSLVSTSHDMLVYHKDGRSTAISTLLSNQTLSHSKEIMEMSIHTAISNTRTTDSICKKMLCKMLCLPKSSHDYVCPPIAGVQEFLFFTKHSHVSSILGFSADNASKSSAFPLGLSASWITHSVYSAVDDTIVWVDSVSESIKYARRDNMFIRTIKSNVKDVGGLAIDWIAGNLYWSEPAQSRISVMRTNGNFSYVLLHEGLHNPSSLTIDPILGFLYWVETKNGDSSIIQSSLSGKNMKKLVEDLDPVSSIIVDPYTSEIHWSSKSKSVFGKCNFNGFDCKTSILNKAFYSPSSITVDESYVYWTDVKYDNGAILRIEKKHLFNDGQLNISKNDDQAGVNSNMGADVLISNIGSTLTSINYFSSANQIGKNPCLFNNGGCQHLCLYEGNSTVTCHCSSSLLDSDNKSCSAHSSYLIYSYGTKIYSLDPSKENDVNPPMPAVTISSGDYNKHSPKSMVYASSLGGLIFTDKLHKSSIYFMQNNIVQNIGYVKNRNIHGLAYSNDLHVLVWTQTSPVAVAYSEYNPLNRNWSKYTTLLGMSNDHHPSLVVLDDCTKSIYWVNRINDTFSIEMYSVHNQQIKTIVNSKNPINAFTIDKTKRVLIWTELNIFALHHIDIKTFHLDTSAVNIIFSESGWEPRNLVSLEGNLYWSDWLTNSIVKFNVQHQSISHIKTDIRKIAAVTVFPDSVPSNCPKSVSLGFASENETSKPENNSIHNEFEESNLNDFVKSKKFDKFQNYESIYKGLYILLVVTIILCLTGMVHGMRKLLCSYFDRKKINVSYISPKSTTSEVICCSPTTHDSPNHSTAAYVYHMEMEYFNQQCDSTSCDDEHLLIQP